ncbi:uncharacterized protein LOC132708379 [Cylas formicarius]|uniref:uncharacterized protein LOC132708379 n=1 Tax=Cylas formicarius TaxID=197179 RepID=UPI0029589308|nr:uncharacterized protein LOC132708379 [Cylas formicarius]
MSYPKDELNNLFKELKSNLDSDKQYWLRNDAKIRAVVSSKTYDEFRNIVDAAHLKSLSKDDIRTPKQNSWNKAL